MEYAQYLGEMEKLVGLIRINKCYNVKTEGAGRLKGGE